MLYRDLQWARQVHRALDGAQPETVQRVNRLLGDLAGFLDSGVLADLRERMAEDGARLRDVLGREDFFEPVADVQSGLARLEQAVADTALGLAEEYNTDLAMDRDRLAGRADWRLPRSYFSANVRVCRKTRRGPLPAAYSCIVFCNCRCNAWLAGAAPGATIWILLWFVVVCTGPVRQLNTARGGWCTTALGKPA